MDDLDLDALEVLAKAAPYTVGKWRSRTDRDEPEPMGDASIVDADDNEIAEMRAWDSGAVHAYMAATAPATLLALITRLRAAEERAERVKQLESRVGVLECKLRNADAQIEAADRALEMADPGLPSDRGKPFAGILELTERLRAAEARTAWQPIETAPLDRRPVLALYNIDCTDIAIGSPITGTWVTRGWPERSIKPIAWMPLPAAPEVTP